MKERKVVAGHKHVVKFDYASLYPTATIIEPIDYEKELRKIELRKRLEKFLSEE